MLHLPVRFRLRAPRLALGLLLAGAGATALAHDSWLRASPRAAGDDLLVLYLQGGARYPRSEGPTPAARLAASGCADGAGRQPLQARGEQPTALELRARTDAARGLACWIELKPQPITLTDALVATYLDDVHAPPVVRDAWARQQIRRVGWSEVYRKFVRLELPAPGPATDLSAVRQPLNLPLELLPLGGAPLRAGVESEFVALADGKPAAGQAVEFVSERSPVGVWRVADERGRFRFTVPFAGEWLLRATALDLPATDTAPVWHSRFSTLTVRVQ